MPKVKAAPVPAPNNASVAVAPLKPSPPAPKPITDQEEERAFREEMMTAPRKELKRLHDLSKVDSAELVVVEPWVVRKYRMEYRMDPGTKVSVVEVVKDQAMVRLPYGAQLILALEEIEKYTKPL